MGKSNRQRRVMKARKRRRPTGPPPMGRFASGRPPHEPLGRDNTRYRAGELLVMAVWSHQRGLDVERDGYLDELAARPPEAVLPDVEARLTEDVGHLWDAGWQPTDLHRYVAKRLGADACRLALVLLAVDARGYESLGHRVAPGWMAQLDALDVPITEADLSLTLRLLAPRWRDSLFTAVELQAVLGSMPSLPRLVDPPSAWVEGRVHPTVDLPAGLLGKIRGLLAKAESTTFDAEAEAYTAKPQELMARHRIDRALLADAAAVEATDVVGRRIGIDDPYASAKYLLLAGLAEVNGARAIWSKSLGAATVFGFPVELDIIEELFTSLLVQATAAMQREGSKEDAYGRSRTKAFRRAFLMAYGDRVAERLRHSVDDTVTTVAAETGTDLVPILAARDEAVAARVDEVFPRLRSMSASISDAEGVFAGRLAADRADLGVGPPIERSA